MTFARGAWDLDAEQIGPAAFFAALPEMLPAATYLEVEGNGMAQDVLALYAGHATGRPLSRRQSLFALPSSRRFRCPLSRAFSDALAKLGRAHTPREIADHLFVFADDRLLLEWHDAFANALLLAPEFSEDEVRGMAARLGVTYGRM